VMRAPRVRPRAEALPHELTAVGARHQPALR
jgi:hypothetical protein